MAVLTPHRYFVAWLAPDANRGGAMLGEQAAAAG
jgi:hypothetical protein